MLCIYHIADHDGKGSGAVVKSVYPQIELLGLNHDMENPLSRNWKSMIWWWCAILPCR